MFVDTLVKLTNTETAATTSPTAIQKFQKATNKRGVLSGLFFGGLALPHLIADIYISISMETFGHRKYIIRGDDGNN